MDPDSSFNNSGVSSTPSRPTYNNGAGYQNNNQVSQRPNEAQRDMTPMSIKKEPNQRQHLLQLPKQTGCVSTPSVTKNLLTRFVPLPTATTVASVMSLN